MAFPIPSHLPRQQDVSSKILSKMDEATGQSLSASLASSWVAELDETIQLTKKRIYERVHVDLPTFERQLASSKSVQERLQSLTNNVDNLSETLSNPESGLVPTLIKGLTTHAALAQDATNATTAYRALSHLQRCRSEFNSLSLLIDTGRLPEAAGTCETLNVLLDEAPRPLNQADIMGDMRRRLRAIKDRTEEQLIDAYALCISVSPTEITTRPSIQIPKSDTTLDICSILASMSPTSLTSHLNTLRRDITAHYIDRTLSQPWSIDISSISDGSHQLSVLPSPPNSEDRTTRLESMCAIITFLQTHLLPSLPPLQKDAWPKSLCRPLSKAVLNCLLVPSLPSSLGLLPAFLELVQKATEFEDKYIVGILGNPAHDKEIKAWADGVGGHYERKRRMEILESARVVIVSAEGSEAFVAEVTEEVTADVEDMPVQGGELAQNKYSLGLDEDSSKQETEENGWGFDDDEPEANPEPSAEQDESADAWGWNDDETSPPDDDPWAEELDEPTCPPAMPSIMKSTTRPDKFVIQGKAPQTNGTPSTQEPLKETYLISRRTKDITRLVEDTLREGQEFASSQLFPLSPSPLGTLILQSALSILDLYRALYPITPRTHISPSSEFPLRFSNDCLYLSREVDRIEGTVPEDNQLKQKFEDSKQNLKVLGDSWFEDCINSRRQLIDDVLAAAGGFSDTGEQDRYDKCESAMTRVLHEIRLLARQWKGLLPKNKYYVALGSVVDAGLSRVLDDILALPDIPEVESHRLSELCRILNTLEGLFVEDTNQPSFHVPSWLKYLYLSELLEASMADISYLFQEGALVDFEIDELVKLVRALFADTSLRTSTISKLMTGHPVPQVIH